MANIGLAETPDAIAKCYPVLSQLRPHLDREGFVEGVEHLMRSGYHLAYFEPENQIHAVAGFRLIENLAWGKYLYLDDLVTDENSRSRGYGRMLFDWLVEHARQNSCQQFHLDSGVMRYFAHKFYLNRGMIIGAHHFMMEL